VEKDENEYRQDLESIVTKLGKTWRGLPIEKIIRFCTNFKVISSIKESGFTVLKLKRK
jgi:hypothetical protein